MFKMIMMCVTWDICDTYVNCAVFLVRTLCDSYMRSIMMIDCSVAIVYVYCGSCVLYNSCVRLCANVFGVGPESDGEALTDRGSRPWG